MFDRRPRPDYNQRLRNIEKKLEKLMADTTALTTAVAANTDATNAAVAAFGAAGTVDQPAVDAATAQIETNTAALVALAPAPPAPAE